MTQILLSRRNALSVVIERRVGKEKLVELLEALSHCEHYVKATQRPQPLAKAPQDLFLDYHFTKFFKNVEGSLKKFFLVIAKLFCLDFKSFHT